MCDIYKDGIESKRKKPCSKLSIKSNNYLDIINDLNECKSLKADTSQSGSQSPSSFTNPSSPVVKHSGFLQNFSVKTLPTYDQLHLRFSNINIKSQRFLKVTNDLKNKIELLEEIYSGPEYKKFKAKNKFIQCNINIDTPERIVLNLISKLQPNSDICSGRSIHPAYSNESADDSEIVADNCNIFKVPSSYHDPVSPISHSIATSNSDNFLADFQPANYDQLTIPDDSFFLEHGGNTYVRVDESNYHLIQSISVDGVITTETGLQLIVPEGTKIPAIDGGGLSDLLVMHEEDELMMNDDQSMTDARQQYHHSQEHIQPYQNLQHQHQNLQQQHHDQHQEQHQHQNLQQQTHSSSGSNRNHSRNYHKDHKDGSGGGGGGRDLGAHYTYQTSNPAKPFSDYVGLPPRPPPHMPFTLSSQLYTPELAIGLTDRDCELMLTIDCSKKSQPQQPSLYYQIYSYRDEDRYTKPTSEVWGLVGEIRACPLPMFCTISIPSGVHKHYFSIRSVDEFNRFSDWSNVVQVEVESNQNAAVNGR